MIDNKRRNTERTIDENICTKLFENQFSKDHNFVEDINSEQDFIIRNDHDTDSEQETESYVTQIEMRSNIEILPIQQKLVGLTNVIPPGTKKNGFRSRCFGCGRVRDKKTIKRCYNCKKWMCGNRLKYVGTNCI